MSRLGPTLVAIAAVATIGWNPASVAIPAEATSRVPASPDTLHVATFAGGCFWCVEEAFDEVEGVVRTTSGYTGGHVEDPSYEEVSDGGTGHLEAVLVIYDPTRVDYDELLDVFWRNIDPTDAGGQFCDRGPSYESAIFYRNDEQKRIAEKTKHAIEERHGFDVVTPIRPAVTFWEAEEYHQNYHQKNPVQYKYYKWRCGRQDRLDELWG